MPITHQRLTRTILFLPEQEGLDLLRDLWISHLVIHATGPGRLAALREWDARFASGEDRQVERVYQDGDTWVYRLLDRSTRSKSPKQAGLWKSAGSAQVGDQPPPRPAASFQAVSALAGAQSQAALE